VLHGVVGFDEAAEVFHDLGTVEELAEEFDFFAEFLVGDGLDEFLGGDAGFGVELGNLLGHRAGDFERVAFASEMRDEAGLVSGFGFDGAAGEEQISDEAVADVAAKAGNAAETGDEAEAEFGETETRHFIGDDEIAEESEFEAAAHAQAVNGSEGDERSGIDSIGDAVDALDKGSQAGDAFLRRKFQGVAVKLFEVAADAETSGAGAGDNAGAGDGCERVDGGGELLEFAEKERANFVERFVVESELDNAVAPFPAEALAAEFFYREKIAAFLFHALVPAATVCLLYI
jgi:hypothetical protein